MTGAGLNSGGSGGSGGSFLGLGSNQDRRGSSVPVWAGGVPPGEAGLGQPGRPVGRGRTGSADADGRPPAWVAPGAVTGRRGKGGGSPAGEADGRDGPGGASAGDGADGPGGSGGGPAAGWPCHPGPAAGG